MKRMLINATQPEECRLAIVDGQKLLDYEIEIAGREHRKGNIYKAVVTRVEPSLEACFVDYGEDRHGFLPFKDIAREYFSGDVPASQAKIEEVIHEGQELLVQVEKEERGNKGAALTTFVSLAGRYVVLMPNNPRGGGVSRRIDGDDRAKLKSVMSELDYPKGMSVIARTAGIGRTAPELQWDLNYLLKLWSAIDSAAKAAKGAFLIYQESNLVIRAIRDYFRSDIGEILIDTDDVYDQAFQFMSHVMPDMASKVKRYRDNAPLFSRFQIEHQIESAYNRTVILPSGGSIVIDRAEALVAIDVNSARAIKGGDIEETATATNLEAADEVARQLRLRDLGGLIVIDFIDMEESANRREVETRLRDALSEDRARVQFGTITKFGLMEMSRQRLKPALSEGASILCPRCGGAGHVRDTESSGLQILRIIQEESMKDSTAAVNAQVPVDVASFLLNEKRSEINKIEVRQRVNVTLIPNKTLETPHYKLERLKYDDPRLDNPDASYKQAEDEEEDTTVTRRSQEPTNRQTPVIKGVLRDEPLPVAAPAAPVVTPAPSVAPAASPAPVVEPAAATGLVGWLKGVFGMKQPDATATPSTAAQAPVETAPAADSGASRTADGRGRNGVRSSGNGGNRRRNVRGNGSGNGRPHGRSGDDNRTRQATGETNGIAATENTNGNGRRPRMDDANGEGSERRPRRRGNRGGARRDGQGAFENGNAQGFDRNEGNGRQEAMPSDSAAREQTAPEAGGQDRAPRGEDRGPRGEHRGGRGRRGGRNRDFRRDADAESSRDDDAGRFSAETAAPVSNGVDEEAPRSYFARDDANAPAETTPVEPVPEAVATPVERHAPARTDANPVAAATTERMESRREPVATPAPVAQAPAAQPQKPYVLPLEKLTQVADTAGLQWVHSDADKVAAVHAAMAAEPKPIHVPREPQPQPVVDTGGLILVETHKDLGKVTLPFEDTTH